MAVLGVALLCSLVACDPAKSGSGATTGGTTSDNADPNRIDSGLIITVTHDFSCSSKHNGTTTIQIMNVDLNRQVAATLLKKDESPMRHALIKADKDGIAVWKIYCKGLPIGSYKVDAIEVGKAPKNDGAGGVFNIV
jgi:hypothetical protein